MKEFFVKASMPEVPYSIDIEVWGKDEQTLENEFEIETWRLTDETLEELGEKWKQDFIRLAKQNRPDG